MRYLRKSLLATLLCLVSMIQAQTNVLRVESVVSPAGKALLLPIVMENTSDIAGVQFDISVPYELATDTVGNVIANLSKTRTANHQVTSRYMGTDGNYYTYVDGNYYYYKKYRIIVYSDDNTLFHGNSGTLLTLKLTTGELADDTQLSVRLSNVTLSDPQMNNVMTSTENGTITIKEIPRPDLQPSDITFTQNEVGPGGVLDVAWKVKNIGKAATEEGSGWSERIELVNAAGTFTKLVATTHFDGQIAAESEVSRSVQIALPQLLTIDGITRVQVTIVPDANAGEDLTLRDNNTAKSVNNLMVTKKLTLEISPDSIGEDSYWKRVTIKLTRSGSWSETQSFKVTATNSKGEPCTDPRIALPEIINIMERESAAILYLDITNNNVLDDDRIINLKVDPINTASTYAPVTGRLIIEDDELPDLTLTASKSVLTEGETFQLTVTTTRVSAQPVTVTLNSENAKRFSFPQTVTIPAGETSVTVDVTAKDDDVPSEALSTAFTASASRYNKGETIVVLEDDDMPVLELQLTPTSVQESAGVVAVAGVLRRITKTNSKITVKLTDDSDGGLYFGNRTLVLDKGVEEVHFNFGPVDNAQVDGDRTYTITASVWLSSCSCSAAGESAGSVTAQLQVLDDDGQALALTSSLGTVKEGGKTELTISRNTATGNALTVTLSSDNDDNLSYNHTVVIPAGQKSTTVEVTSASNNVSGDTHTVVFTVAANGYSSGTCFLMVTDQTLPDARISSITADTEEAEVGAKTKLTIVVTNEGAAELPAEVAVKIYRRGDDNAVGTIYTSEAVVVGESTSVVKTITLPTTVGTHNYYAVVNPSNAVQELAYNNNTSADMAIATVSPFSVAINTDKTIYKQGDKVIITGQLTGSGIADTDIDLYIINEGARQVQTVKTDKNGAFTYEWQLYALQSGNFVVGACYHDEGATTGICAFDVYGLRRTDTNYITCEVAKGETMNGQVDFINPGMLALSGVKAEILSQPENCEASVQIPTNISGGSTINLSYSLKGTEASPERKWDEVKARITTAEGVTQDVTLYFYCFNQHTQLVTNVKRLNTTITKGTTRDYPLMIVNTGKAESGDITLALPEFMTCESGAIIPSIGQNDTVIVVLRMMTNDKMQLNVPVTGTIGVNCENGDGFTIDYSVEMVSEEKGTLQVDVCDEYTYYTDEAPHVSGAEVVVSHPYTGVVLARGTTDNDGIFNIELPEGYYEVSVSADKHEQYTNYCNVNPGTTEHLVVNISYQPITIQWEVKETEVEDDYEIVTTVQYETNVPMPVVKVTLPKSIDGDNMAVGDAVIVNMLLTNVGLITAEEVELDLPNDMTEWKFEALAYTDPFQLGPQQMVSVPILITRIADESIAGSRLSKNAKEDEAYNMISNYQNCMAGLGARYKALCGDELKNNKAAERMAMKLCAISAALQFLLGGGGGGLGKPGDGGGGKGGKGGGSTKYGSKKVLDICDPCDAARMEAVINAALGLFKFFGPINDAFNNAIEAAQKSRDEGKDPGASFYAGKIGENIVDNGIGGYLDNKLPGGNGVLNIKKPGGGKFYSIAKGIYKTVTACKDIKKNSQSQSRIVAPRKVATHSWVEVYDAVAWEYLEQLAIADTLLTYAFGDSIWFDEMDDEKAAFVKYVCGLPQGYMPSEEELMERKPESVSLTQMWAYVNRIVVGESDGPTAEDYERLLRKFLHMNNSSISKGYSSLTDEYIEAYDTYVKHFEDMKSSSICASITLQFKQTMTMTRQAFQGSLIVFNGHESIPMENLSLNLKVTNPQTGKVATSHEFQINVESLDGFTGELDLGSGWTLDANSTGTATILFIPTKYAAPDEPVDWSFGGTLSYTDPFTGVEVTRELYPVTLTVKPSPELDLTYFMQRDVYGDDALTLDVIEPMKPAEFALLINNQGNGDATNVGMVTQQPEIIDNEKGLYIDFKLISSQVNGNDAALSFGQSIANDFGTIPAHSQTYAQWWMTSSLLGHFTAYDVQANHITSYGNEDLSLLGDVTIHELIRSLDLSTDSKKMVGFLVNDITDSEDIPDMLYLSNGETKTVSVAAASQISKTSRTTYSLTVTPSETGWTYGSIKDPTYGMSELKSIVRQRDGKEINLRNFWQTDRTLRDGSEPLYENRIHFADEFATVTPEVYLLTFEPMPDLVLEVASIATVPKEGTIAESPIETLTVAFNKAIDSSTFTSDDITFTVQGVKQDASKIGVSTKDNKTFTLDLTSLTEQCPNGYYTLTVQTTDITDNEGFKGKDGKQVSWVLFRGGLVQLRTSAYPENSGAISFNLENVAGVRRLNPANEDTNSAQYGSTFTLIAEPSTGYDFSNWTMNGEVVSNEPEYTTTALSDMNIVANFTKKKYLVEISSTDDAKGNIAGAGTGYYDYGTKLELSAVPAEDYVLKNWTVDGEAVENSTGNLSLTAEGPLTITAEFLQEYFRQSMTLARGWNWMSSYLSEPLAIDGLSDYVYRIVSQTDEIINDPEYGLVGNISELEAGKTYKVEANYRFTNTFRGHLYNVGAAPIVLHKGWNWVAYPSQEQTALATAITNAEEGDYISSQTGFAGYAEGHWEGTLDMLTPGAGYLYKSVSDKTLAFDFSSAVDGSRAWKAQTATVTEQDVDIHRYPNTMNMTVQIVKDEMTTTASDYSIYAMVGDELRGISQSIGRNQYLTVYGDKPVEVTFVVESAETGETYVATETLKFVDDVIGSRKQPFVLNIGSATGIDVMANDGHPMTVYTLQGVLVSREATLKMLRRLPKGVYVVNGQKCFIK